MTGQFVRRPQCRKYLIAFLPPLARVQRRVARVARASVDPDGLGLGRRGTRLLQLELANLWRRRWRGLVFRVGGKCGGGGGGRALLDGAAARKSGRQRRRRGQGPGQHGRKPRVSGSPRCLSSFRIASSDCELYWCLQISEQRSFKQSFLFYHNVNAVINIYAQQNIVNVSKRHFEARFRTTESSEHVTVLANLSKTKQCNRFRSLCPNS